MNFARFSPVLLLTSALLSSLIGTSTVQAGASNKNGDPYGNGTFFPDSGSYSSIVRSTNGFVGTIEFTTGGGTNGTAVNTSTNATTNSGIASIFAAGQQFIGSAYGVSDPSSGSLAVTYSANTGALILALPTVSYNSQVFETSSGGAVSVTTPVYGITNFSVSNSISGQFTAQLKNSYPTQTFLGTGVADAAVQDVTTFAITNDLTTNAQTGGTQIVYQYIVTQTNVVYSTEVIGSRVTVNSSGQ